MSTYVDSDPRTGVRKRGALPAYGPIDAAFGYVVFYVFVDRATPTIVDVFSDVLAVSPSLVGLGLAAALWFILAVTLVDQVRRQLAALGIGTHPSVSKSRWVPDVPSEIRLVVYLALVSVGGTVSVLTFDRAIDAGISMIRVVATVDVSAIVPLDFVAMIVFFVAFGLATHALDRLLIGGVRALFAGSDSPRTE
jgi:hypothetical protein